MTKLYDAIPEFMKRLEAALRNQGCPDLADEVPALELEDWHYARTSDAIGMSFVGGVPWRRHDDTSNAKYEYTSFSVDDFLDVMVDVFVGRNDKLLGLDIIGPGPDRLCDRLATELEKLRPGRYYD